MDELATVALANYDARVRFETRATTRQPQARTRRCSTSNRAGAGLFWNARRRGRRASNHPRTPAPEGTHPLHESRLCRFRELVDERREGPRRSSAVTPAVFAQIDERQQFEPWRLQGPRLVDGAPVQRASARPCAPATAAPAAATVAGTPSRPVRPRSAALSAAGPARHGVAGQQQRLGRIAEHFAGPGVACRAGCFVRRPRGSGASLRVADLRASAQPRNHRHAVRPCSSADSSTSSRILLGQRRHPDPRCPDAPQAKASYQAAVRRAIGWRSSTACARARCTCARHCWPGRCARTRRPHPEQRDLHGRS